jgi:hypothetical protein
MCPAIDNIASYGIRAVIRFPCPENVSTAEILRELSAIYGQSVMSEGTVRQWCRMFKDWQTNVLDEQQSGQPSVMSDDLVQRQRFTISKLQCEFSQISCTVLYEIIIVGLSNHKFCARWIPKMIMGAHKHNSMFLFKFTHQQ